MGKHISKFDKNLSKYKEFRCWVLWYPDLFLDLIRPQSGGINLNSDQRVFLRCATRFFSLYGCFPRGWGKTWAEFLAMVIVCVVFPNIELALTAQTKENSAALLSDKYTEIIRQYPMLGNEVTEESFQKSKAEILFKNGARIDNLANSQSSKGQRRRRLSIEESVLMNNETFEDALKPIVEVSRYTCGKLAIINPEELNQQINFFTTPGWRGSDEFDRSLKMIDNMVDLKGDMVLGSNWMLGCWYGRGSSKSQILQKKKDMSPTAFDQNYGGKWTGSSTGALVNVNKLLECLTLTRPELKGSKDGEYYLGVDVARSQNTNNNQTVIVPVKVRRCDGSNRILAVEVVNIIMVPNVLNFAAQACLVKREKRKYNAKVVVVDGNGLGAGLIDELLKESFDPDTGESLGCWDTINTTNTPEIDEAEKCVYDMKAQSSQSKIISTFIDMVDSKKLRLLERRKEESFSLMDQDYEEIMPYLQTEFLFEEISNLRLIRTKTGGLSVEKVVSKIDKDRFSALIYVLYYINEYVGHNKNSDNTDLKDYIQRLYKISRKPKSVF